MSTLINFNKDRNIGLAYFPKKKIIRKFSITKKNNKLIKNEINGIKWYFSLKKNINKNYLNKVNKNSIDLKVIKGKQINYWSQIDYNLKYIEKVVLHYKKVWPKKNLVPFHGDLTFSNIIFNKSNLPLIIDWENFSKKKMYWGFDLAYFLISTVALPCVFLKKDTIDKGSLELLHKIWDVAFKNKNFPYLKNPINFFKKNYKKTFILRKFNNYYPNLLSKKIIKDIHDTIN